MLFPVWLLHVSRACTALSKHGVGVEAPFWPDFWDRGRAFARGGGVHCPCSHLLAVPTRPLLKVGPTLPPEGGGGGLWPVGGWVSLVLGNLEVRFLKREGTCVSLNSFTRGC